MNSKTLVSLLVVALLGAAGWWYASRGTSAAGTQEAAPVTAAAASSPQRAQSSDAGAPEALREAVVDAPRARPEPSATHVLDPQPAAKSRTVAGRVLDASGSALSSVKLVARSNEPGEKREAQLISDALGRFTLADAPASGSVVSGDRSLATVLRADFRAGESREPILVLAQRLELAGDVVDESGALLEGVELSIEVPADFRARFKEVLDWSVTGSWHFTTEADGRFEFDDVPDIEGARLRVELRPSSRCRCLCRPRPTSRCTWC
jgi:hypothetical protein